MIFFLICKAYLSGPKQEFHFISLLDRANLLEYISDSVVVLHLQPEDTYIS